VNWGAVTERAVVATGLSTIVNNRRGEQAALGFLGNQLGNLASDVSKFYRDSHANNFIGTAMLINQGNSILINGLV